MGRAERGVILTLLGLGVAGHALTLLGGGGRAPGEVRLPGLAAASPRAQRQRAAAAGRPLQPGETIDPDRASVPELARLPGIGMRLAKEIVADREIRGSFGSPEALDRVDGIGPATVRRLEPFLRFGRRVAAGDQRLNLNRAGAKELERLPGIGPARARAILAYREAHGPFAEPADLARVPGVSAKLAASLAGLVDTK